MWKILQYKKPEDFVICTGKQYTIKQFINMVAKQLKLRLRWKGKGLNEKGVDENNNVIIECKKKYLRPAEVDTLKEIIRKLGNYLIGNQNMILSLLSKK